MSKDLSLTDLGDLAKEREKADAAKSAKHPTKKKASKKGARLKKTKAKTAAKKTTKTVVTIEAPEPVAKKPVAKVLRVFIGPIGRDVRSEDRKVPSFVMPLTPALALKRAFAVKGIPASLKDSTLPNNDNEPLQLLTLDRFPWVTACKEAVANPDFPGFVQFGPAVQYLRKGIEAKLTELGFEVDMGEWAPPRAQPQTTDPFAKVDRDDAYSIVPEDMPPF